MKDCRTAAGPEFQRIICSNIVLKIEIKSRKTCIINEHIFKIWNKTPIFTDVDFSFAADKSAFSIKIDTNSRAGRYIGVCSGPTEQEQNTQNTCRQYFSHDH